MKRLLILTAVVTSCLPLEGAFTVCDPNEAWILPE